MDNNQNSSSPPLQDILSKLKKVKYIGSDRYMAECPAHQDMEPSLSITTGDDGRVLLKCHAGCKTEDVVKAIGMEMKDLFPPTKRGRGMSTLRKKPATLQQSGKPSENKKEKQRCSEKNRCSVDVIPPLPPDGQGDAGCNLHQYGKLKKLPLSFLQQVGCTTIKYLKKDALRMPYYAPSGEETAVQFRIALQGTNKFRWRTGSKPCLYGMNRAYKSNGEVIICEGASDCHTLWFNGFSALGLPGATNWKEDRDAQHLEGIETIYVVIEPDQGGVAIQKWLAISQIRHRVKLLTLGGDKDPSELFLHDPDNFKTNLKQAMAKAVPWSEIMDQQAATEKAKAWAICRTLAEDKNILSRFGQYIERVGVAGESRNAKLLYLMLTSRHQKKPGSGILKGPSASGKSFLVDQILRFFPSSAYYGLTSMSEHALAYSEEPLANRFLILFEAAGISSDFANYLLRSLLSEGRIRYETVEKTSEGMKPRLIEREGPTGVIITTTQIRLHPENETRLLSINISDTPEQTQSILLAISEGENEIDLTEWQALQEWIDLSEHRVVVPYAKALAERIPPVAVRLRRDFTQMLNLIKSHAILHQATREKDSKGRLISTIEDYAVVRELVCDVISDGVEATVSPTTRDTVNAVAKIIENGESSATVQRLAMALKIDKSAASRRYAVAKNKGYVVNNEKQKGKPAQIVIGDPLPEDVQILPHPSELGCCSVDRESGGVNTPPPLPRINEHGYEVMDDGQITY
jgi:hypothetical protein